LGQLVEQRTVNPVRRKQAGELLSDPCQERRRPPGLQASDAGSTPVHPAVRVHPKSCPPVPTALFILPDLLVVKCPCGYVHLCRRLDRWDNGTIPLRSHGATRRILDWRRVDSYHVPAEYET